MKTDTHTEPGGKLVNEDFVMARRHPAAEDLWIVALADGQGGRSNAAPASRAACEAVWSAASAPPSHQLLEAGTWPGLLQQADDSVALTGGFTTLVACAISPDAVAGASVGDSKACFMRTPADEMTELTESQRKNPPAGSGSMDAVPFMCRAVGGGRLLVVSDGVWKYCGYEALRSSFAQPAGLVAGHLRSALFQRSGSTLPDDFSLILIEVE